MVDHTDKIANNVAQLGTQFNANVVPLTLIFESTLFILLLYFLNNEWDKITRNINGISKKY